MGDVRERTYETPIRISRRPRGEQRGGVTAAAGHRGLVVTIVLPLELFLKIFLVLADRCGMPLALAAAFAFAAAFGAPRLLRSRKAGAFRGTTSSSSGGGCCGSSSSSPHSSSSGSHST